MKWELINPPKESVKETLLTNRGVKKEDIDSYLNLDSRVVRPISDLYSDKIGTNFLFAKDLIEHYMRRKNKNWTDISGFLSHQELVKYCRNTRRGL